MFTFCYICWSCATSTAYISYGLVSPHLENPQDFPMIVLYLERFVAKHATAHIQEMLAVILTDNPE